LAKVLPVNSGGPFHHLETECYFDWLGGNFLGWWHLIAFLWNLQVEAVGGVRGVFVPGGAEESVDWVFVETTLLRGESAW
jgi:hypothetical protein